MKRLAIVLAAVAAVLTGCGFSAEESGSGIENIGMRCTEQGDRLYWIAGSVDMVVVPGGCAAPREPEPECPAATP